LSSSLNLWEIAEGTLEEILGAIKIDAGEIVVVKKGEIKHVYNKNMDLNSLSYKEVLMFLKRKGPFILFHS
jgi:hypothetical protein